MTSNRKGMVMARKKKVVKKKAKKKKSTRRKLRRPAAKKKKTTKKAVRRKKKNPQWTPITERLPMVGRRVVTLMRNNDLLINAVQRRNRLDAAGEYVVFVEWENANDSVTHWLDVDMPRPMRPAIPSMY